MNTPFIIGFGYRVTGKTRRSHPRGYGLAVRLERLTANAKVGTVLSSITASSKTVESEGRQMKQC
jgi:hypothetical protein